MKRADPAGNPKPGRGGCHRVGEQELATVLGDPLSRGADIAGRNALDADSVTALKI